MTTARMYAVPATIIILLFSFCAKERTYRVELKDGVRRVHSIEPAEDSPLVRLEFVRKIGELETEDEHYMFQMPISVDRDDYGFLYVLDPDAHKIKKFDREGRYVLEFGRSGQGPGEFQYPQSLSIGGEGILLVSTMSSLFHVFDLEGTYVDRIQMERYQGLFSKMMHSGNFVGFSMLPNSENSPDNQIMKIYDLKGDVIRSFGDPFILDSARFSWIVNFLSITVDLTDNIFINFVHQNRIEKYSPEGELLLVVTRELPFALKYGKKKEIIDVGGEAREIDTQDFTRVGSGIGVDPKGRIWVATLMQTFPEDFKAEDYIPQDFLTFEVFSPEGILLFKLQIPEELKNFDNWTLVGDTIYFVDPREDCCVHEYRILEE